MPRRAQARATFFSHRDRVWRTHQRSPDAGGARGSGAGGARASGAGSARASGAGDPAGSSEAGAAQPKAVDRVASRTPSSATPVMRRPASPPGGAAASPRRVEERGHGSIQDLERAHRLSPAERVSRAERASKIPAAPASPQAAMRAMDRMMRLDAAGVSGPPRNRLLQRLLTAEASGRTSCGARPAHAGSSRSCGRSPCRQPA